MALGPHVQSTHVDWLNDTRHPSEKYLLISDLKILSFNFLLLPRFRCMHCIYLWLRTTRSSRTVKWLLGASLPCFPNIAIYIKKIENFFIMVASLILETINFKNWSSTPQECKKQKITTMPNAIKKRKENNLRGYLTWTCQISCLRAKTEGYSVKWTSGTA